MGINNPIPRSLKSETKKAAKILANFVKPNQILGVDQVIPPELLQNAKGLAILTVLKAGFLFSGRAGSGVIVARLPDGSWSPPSAIATAGAGAGGQVGVELTDFVFILNTEDAVKSFAQAGSITLGGNVSVAAGPLGRNAEAGGTASLKGAAAIYSYSKTKGLFAGVSLEGSAIVERREANRKFYGNNCKAVQILSGRVEPPPECDALFRVLESRAFTKRRPGDYYDDSYYSDIPDFDSGSDTSSFSERRSRDRSESYSRGNRGGSSKHSDNDDSDDDYYSSRRGNNSGSNNNSSNNKRSSYGRNNSYSRSSKPTSWEDDVYDSYDTPKSRRANRNSDDYDDLDRRFRKSSISDKPAFSPRSEKSKGPKAIALFSFEGEQSGDLPFRKGDVITIIKKSDSQDDWWTGRVNGKEGIFPANYVELA
ncbi:LAS seventeen-binding protein 3 Short=LAS17-binding protein 3 [Cyberlindnera jadinii]|uniref:DUF500-domain-containing protein n=1 Tax=Cyberlindnera jadinii (strain ATCC 18201 / CBS 1600 / BCRC 20928 / JCM 3617 / NBRC 0987 / NRRL Y-1542) TaxID=983966 RepID=A0A0H5C2M4_CYBJN|nr:DUF500-domain-containing protein [Cyberlindnera jadinii NRRL Y-1542]ODV72882.1 DUF500-domain-containing protein [Cyberlindnera jadinii NRRL Y-1542]CEP22103.1 LAS seventeen-binding protein 3 Short=LAS17-binding protein 3 [Cyberlindnera jadinii]